MIELLGPLRKTYLPLIRNVLKSPAKSVLISIGITEAASGTNAAIHIKNVWIWRASFGLSKANGINDFKQRNE